MNQGAKKLHEPGDGSGSRESAGDERRDDVASAESDEFAVRTDAVAVLGCILLRRDDTIQETGDRDQPVRLRQTTGEDVKR